MHFQCVQALDGFGTFIGRDVGSAGVHVDEHLDEECLVEDLAGALAGESVDFAGVVEQVEQDLDGLSSGVDLWVVGGGELALEAFAFVADLAEPLADFFFGPFWVADEVEVAVFLPIQLPDLGLELFAQGAGCFVLHFVGRVHHFADLGLESCRDVQGAVVVYDGVLDLSDGQVRQVAGFVAPAAA